MSAKSNLYLLLILYCFMGKEVFGSQSMANFYCEKINKIRKEEQTCKENLTIAENKLKTNTNFLTDITSKRDELKIKLIETNRNKNVQNHKSEIEKLKQKNEEEANKLLKITEKQEEDLRKEIENIKNKNEKEAQKQLDITEKKKKDLKKEIENITNKNKKEANISEKEKEDLKTEIENITNEKQKLMENLNGKDKKLGEIVIELNTKRNQLGNMSTIMESYHENADINIIKSTNSCEQYYDIWKKTTNWNDRPIIDPQLANKCFKDVFEKTKLNAKEGSQTNKEILEKILIGVCVFFILVIGICAYCIRRKHITLHNTITELQKTNTYRDISAEISVPLGAILGPTHIPRGRSYECGTQDPLSFTAGRKLINPFTTSTTYYCAPQKMTYQQELERRTMTVSQPLPLFSLENTEYKPCGSNPEKFKSILYNSEIKSCDYQSAMDAENA